MRNNIELQNEEALVNAFKIEELEERLEMAPWNNGSDPNGKNQNSTY